MAKPSGEIIETPIISNFKEGLDVLEYFNSTHGARKGLADTALKTANSGYLTRRLVDVAQDCIVTEDDCGTEQGIEIAPVIDGADIVVPLGTRILGRTTAEDVVHPGSGKIVVPRDTYLDEDLTALVEKSGVRSVKVRSVLTCEAKIGVCAACYGRDLARGTRVNVGEAVGVIAAQSIGEPGTQLTMRTFHIGGAAQVADSSSMEAAVDGRAKYVEVAVLTRDSGEIVVNNRSGVVAVVDGDGVERQSFKLPFGARLRVKDGQAVKKGDRLVDWDPFSTPILTEVAGKVRFEDLEEGKTLREETDDATNIANMVVIDPRGSGSKASDLRPAIVIVGADGEPVRLPSGKEARYILPVGAILSVRRDEDVDSGKTLARTATGGARTRDITGGLPRVAELFEARRPKDHAVIAEVDGRVEFLKDYKNKRRIKLHPTDESLDPIEYMIPKVKHVLVQDGDEVKRGDFLIDGNPAPQDLLSVMGVEKLADFLVEEIQKVYRLQGVPINDKHIEVIVRQMLQKVEITDPGGTDYLVGEPVDAADLEEENMRIEALNLAPAKGSPMLLGITKASLQTRSFISAASFQETTKVLTDAATYGKRDTLEGLKENVIVGRLIPAGTGGALTRYKVLAKERDEARLAAEKADRDAAIAASEKATEAAE
jgi:DNA-directed RNA polymerase subunit beta'